MFDPFSFDLAQGELLCLWVAVQRPSLMVSASCWVCLFRPWASHPLECGLSSAPGDFVWFFKTLGIFSFLGPYHRIKSRSIRHLLTVPTSLLKGNIPKQHCHCLKCLVEMLRKLAGTLQREALQTIPRHRPCPATLSIPRGGPDSERRTPVP